MSHVTTRTADLRSILSERRRAVRDEVKSRIRDGRSERSHEVRDDIEYSDADLQGDHGWTRRCAVGAESPAYRRQWS